MKIIFAAVIIFLKNKNMIRSLLKLAALLVVGILIYNYFLGSPDEKANAKNIFGKVKDVGVEVGKLLKTEKEKFDEGKYDQALDKIDDIFKDLKTKAKDIDEKYIPKIEELEKQREDLGKRLRDTQKESENDATKNKEMEKLKTDLNDLLEQTKNLMEDMNLKDK